MKSEVVKVLHPIAGIPMIEHVIRSIKEVGLDQVYVVIGHQGAQVEQAVSEVKFVNQHQQLGTGHAVDQCRNYLADFDGSVIVAYGDAPLFRGETFAQLLDFHHNQKATATVITTHVPDPTGYGRVIRSAQGSVQSIVEHKDATIDQQKITEINTGTYCFNSRALFEYLQQITPVNAQAEYYLPDVLPLMIQDGLKVLGYTIDDYTESMGVNNRVQLAEADKIMRERIRNYWMLQGVTLVDPGATYIDVDCQIGQDTLIYPGTILEKGVIIGEGCVVGPNTRVRGSRIGNRVTLDNAVVVDSNVGDHTQIGPFAYLRPGTRIGNHCKVGDFVEVKNSQVADYSKIPHHSYIGDAQVGSGVNIGCGTITCNYDGKAKHRTIIEDHAFIGSNSSLVAPVTIGKHSYVAAGSTITDDVPAQSLAFGRARQVIKEGRIKTEVNSSDNQSK